MWKKLWLLMIGLFLFITPSYAALKINCTNYIEIGKTATATVNSEDNVNWESSDRTIAQIDNNGNIITGAKGGYVTITATTGGQTVTKKIFVWNANLSGRFFYYNSKGSKGTVGNGHLYIGPKTNGNYKILACGSDLKISMDGSTHPVGCYLKTSNGFGRSDMDKYWKISSNYGKIKELPLDEEWADPDEGIIQYFSAKLDQNGTKFNLSGKTYLAQEITTVEDTSRWEVIYEDENGDIRTAIREEGSNQYYTEETNEPINIIFSVDMGSGDEIDGYEALGEEEHPEKATGFSFEKYPIDITFPFEIKYNGQLVSTISLPGVSKVFSGDDAIGVEMWTVDDCNANDLNSTWSIDEIDLTEISAAAYDEDRDEYYIPIIITSAAQSIECRYVVDLSKMSFTCTEPMASIWDSLKTSYTWVMKQEEILAPNSSIVELSDKVIDFNAEIDDYKEEGYKAGDTIKLKGNACKHLLKSTKTDIKLAYEIKYGPWTRYLSYLIDHTGGHYSTKRYAYPPAGSKITSKKVFAFYCNNGYNQYRRTYYYSAPQKKAVHENDITTSNIGELICPIDIEISGFRVKEFEDRKLKIKQGKVYVKYNGIDTILDDETAKKYIALINDFTTGAEADWSGVFTIDRFSNEVIAEQGYDEERGLHYGTITVTCDNRSKVFRIYFAPPREYSVTYKTIPADLEFTYPGLVPNDITKVDAGTSIFAGVSNTNVNLGNSRYRFKEWKYEEYPLDNPVPKVKNISDANYSFTMPAANVVMTAIFEDVSEYTLTVLADPGEGGTVGPNRLPSYSVKYGIKDIKAGQICELIPNPNTAEKWSFVSWTIYDANGIAVQPIEDDEETGIKGYDPETGIVKIKMPESDVVAAAHFRSGYTVTFIAGVGGTIGEGKVDWYQERYSIKEIENGLSISLPKVNPDGSYEFFTWEIEPMGNTTSIKNIEYNIETGVGKFTMPMDNVTAKAIFSPADKYTLDVIATPPSHGTVGGSDENITNKKEWEGKVISYQKAFTEDEINEGITEFLTAEPNPGYEYRRPVWTISEYDLEGNLLSQYSKDDSEFDFNMPLSKVIATAWFVEQASGYRVTFETNPPGAGKVPVDLSAVSVGEHVKLTVEAYAGYEFTGWTFERADGTQVYIQIKTKTNANGEVVEYFEMPEFDVVAVANFKKTGAEGEYTLYVTSTMGGNAWTDGNEKHPDVIQITEGLPDGKVMYKIEKVKAGEVFEIEYEITEAGYKFKHWKYKPNPGGVETVNSNTIKVIMPDSDMTVTAVFKNDEKPNDGEKPKLKVTSNNIGWGTAWTVINKEETSMDKTYEAEAYKEYTIYFEASSGYYFTGWEYTTTNSPFITGITKTKGGDGEFIAGYATIRMPNVKYLEIMGMFSPKPQNIGHNVEFSAIPEEGGTVPEDLENVEPGTRVELSVEVNPGYEFDGWIFKDENGRTLDIEIKTETYIDENGKEVKIEYFIMPDSDVKAIAQFTDPQGTYTLYVTAMTGGTAWTDGNSNHPKSSVKQITEGLPEGQIMYKIEEVKAGEEFEIEFRTNAEYTFSNWEFRVKDVVWEELELKESGERVVSGKILIKMPTSDLTVTAIFKDDTVRDNPWLKVTSNNIEWGSAWAKISNTVNTKMTEKYDEDDGVIPGKRYELHYQVKEGYYFTGWRYSTTENPFVWSNGKLYVEMPTSNLEVMAMFSPKPDGEGYSVKFEADPPEGGKVPSNISNVEEGTKIELTVTPNPGYALDKWVFKDDKGKYVDIEIKKNPITGTEYFVMPDFNITAIAIFTDNVPPKVITIIIQGQGTVTSEGINIPSGGTITGNQGDNKPLIATPDTDWIFEYWVSEDGDILSRDPNYIYTIEDDATIIAVFRPKGPYTLYVTSYYGGNAWISEILAKTGPYDYTIEKIGPDNLGKYIYKIDKVYAGDRFKIEYSITEEDYKFGFWEYKPFIEAEVKSGNTIEITMPTSDLTVTAIFKNDTVKDEPELSITTNNPNWGTAWTIINGEKTVIDQKYTDVTIGKEYTVYYEAKPGYYFINWNYSTSETPFISEDVIVMPDKDLEVMAMFAPIPPQGEGGHKITFEAEPPEGGKVPDDSALVNILPGGKITIAVTVNQGWEFDYWRFENAAGEAVYPEVKYDPITGTGYFIMPNYDVVAIAVFKPAAQPGKFKLTVTAEPEHGGRVNIEKYNAVEVSINNGTEVTVTASENSRYVFKYWYVLKNGNKVRVSDDEKYTFRMPSENRELIALFKKPGIGEDELYDLTVSVDPENAGTAIIKGYGDIRENIMEGTQCTVIATVKEKEVINGYSYSYVFEGWFDADASVSEPPVSTSLTYTFPMTGRDLHLVASISVITAEVPLNVVSTGIDDSFRIVSVRDLKWKDYFTTPSGTLTGKYFSVPQTNETMLNTAYDDKGKRYTQPIKMGYAVEFELDTISVPYNSAYIEITPQLVDKYGNSIDKNKIYYGEDKLIEVKAVKHLLSPITIYANRDNDPIRNNVAYTSFMAEAESKARYYNGQNQDFITWRWLYYLPAETEVIGLKDEVTVRFDIKVKSTAATTPQHNQIDLVTDYQVNKNYSWSGKAFTYSLKESLLDDIYNNAQN